jgi:hypothetical protein
MASTRNKNTPGNYAEEKKAYEKRHNELMYLYGSQGQAMQTNIPGNGLLQGRVAGRNLAKNDCDVESRLFGIGSTNLENAQSEFTAEMYDIKSLNVMKKIPMIMPRQLGIQTDQRPMYLN